MKYVGSKNRLSKELAPIIQSYITDDTEYYIEPFVGGANMIDKIKHKNKIGSDVHKELISLLTYIQNLDNKLPKTITEDVYVDVRDNKEKHSEWYVGLVGFNSTFGAKYFGGYARGFKADKITPRDLPNEAIRNLEKQRVLLTDVSFIHASYDEVPKRTANAVIYCDPPYKGTLKYSTNPFDYDKFYEWCRNMAKNNIVLVSEYNMPDDFECIWSKEHKVGINQDKHQPRLEKLFILKSKY